MKRHRIILDCDTKNEIDDQFAIAYALGHRKVQLEGVVSVQNTNAHGERSADLYNREARKLMRLAQSDVPALRGSRRVIASRNKPEQSPGVDFIIERARALGPKLTVVGTGPPTDLATACLLAPEVMAKCRYIWIGGFRGNAEVREYKARECNFVGDPLGFDIMMQSHPDITMLPVFNVTERMMIHCRSFVEMLRATNTPLNHYLAYLLASVKDRWRIMWDVAAVAAAFDFGITATRRVPACTTVRRRPIFPDRGRTKITLVEDIDEFAMLADFKKVLCGGG